MSAAPDQYSCWKDALAGKPVDSEVGNPRSGFWKGPQDEPIAIWRDETGKVCCERVRFGGGSGMSLDQIDELYASASRYPIDEATYDAARAGNPPDGFKTRLTGKECQANVVWSLDLGRKKLGAKAAEPAPAAATSQAAAPEADPTQHTFAGERTPDLVMTEEISTLGCEIKGWLGTIGGEPRDKAEADQIADYATKYGALHKKAEAARVEEKQPHLDAGREVDAKWKRPVSNAENGRKRCLEIAQKWRDEENARREAEAANARATAPAAAPVEVERVGGLGNIRTVAERSRTTWQLDDPRAYLRHLIEANTELPGEIVEAARKVANHRGVEAPGVSKQMTKVAA